MAWSFQIIDLLIPQSWKWRRPAFILSMTRIPIKLDSVQIESIYAKVVLLKADSISMESMVQVQSKNICSKTGTGALTAFCAAKGVSLSSWYLRFLNIAESLNESRIYKIVSLATPQDLCLWLDRIQNPKPFIWSWDTCLYFSPLGILWPCLEKI